MRKLKDRYRKAFVEENFLHDLEKRVIKLSLRGIHDALLLFYAFRRRETPFWAKSIIVGVLGYLISPIDSIPDLTPILGYTDDFNLIIIALTTLAAFIDDEVQNQAEAKMGQYFDKYIPV